MSKCYKHNGNLEVQAVVNGVNYKVYYTTDTKNFGGFAWLIETDKGGQRLYPASCSPEWAIRHWASGNPPLKKSMTY